MCPWKSGPQTSAQREAGAATGFMGSDAGAALTSPQKFTERQAPEPVLPPLSQRRDAAGKGERNGPGPMVPWVANEPIGSFGTKWAQNLAPFESTPRAWHPYPLSRYQSLRGRPIALYYTNEY